MSGFKREYTDPKEVAKDLLKVGVGKLVEKGFKKIPGYTKVKETIDKSGFSLSAGKDSVGITFTKKLGGKKKKKKKYD